MSTPAAAAAPPQQNRSLTEVWLITIGHSLTHWYPATFYLLLPLIGKELGLTYSEIGLIMTCQYIAGAVSNIPGGMLVDTIGRKGLLMGVSLFWVGFPYLLMNFTSSYLMLLVCVALVGIGNNLWHPTAIPTLAHRFPERKGLVLSLHGMGGNVGDALAYVVVGALLAVMTWRQVVVLNVVPGMVMAVLIVMFLGKLQVSAKGAKVQVSEGQSLSDYFTGLKVLFKNKSLIWIALGSGFRSMTQNALLTFLPLYLANVMGYEVFWVGVAMFVLQAAGFIATPISGHLSDKMGRRKILMTSMAMTAVVLVFMALAGRSTVFVLFIAVLGFFLYAVRPVLQAWLMDSTPKNMAGTSVGVLFGVQSLTSAISPFIAGIIADAYGLHAMFYFLAITIVIANLLIFLVPEPKQGATN